MADGMMKLRKLAVIRRWRGTRNCSMKGPGQIEDHISKEAAAR